MMIHPRHLPLLAVLLAACGADDGGDARGTVADSASAPATAADTARPDSTPAAPAAEQGTSTVTLAPDGLYLAAPGAAPRRIAFGSGRAGVLAEIGAVMGAPTQQGTMEECPSGPLFQASFAPGLQLSFQDSAFVGWFAEEGSALRTAAGVGPGSTLGQLRAAYPGTKVEETSLGQEFNTGDLYGIVTDTTDAAQVQVIFAGTSCIFR